MRYEGKAIRYLFFIIIIVLLLLAVYLMSIGNNKLAANIEEKTKKEEIKDAILIGIINLDTINPLLTKNMDVQYLLKLVYEPLLDISKDFELEPKLAKEYSMLDNKTYIIKLRDDKFFCDGEKFTAEDVVFTVNAIKNTWQNSVYYNNVKFIQDISIIDDYTIKIYLKEEVPFFEYKLVMPILPKHQYNEESKLLYDKPCGTGAYYFERISNQEITLVNNNAKTKKIKVLVYDRNSDMYSDFIKGNVDLITSTNINYERYIGSIGYKKIIVPGRNFYYILINENNLFLQDKVLRQTIKLAINKREIIYNVYNNKYLELNFPSKANISNKTSDSNMNEALNSLENSGYSLKKDSLYKNGKKLVLTLSVNQEDDLQVEAAQIIKENLQETGITINIIKLSKTNYEYNLRNNYYNLALAKTTIYLEPDYSEYFNKSRSDLNTLLTEIKEINNQDIQKEKIDKLEKIAEDEIPFIGLYIDTNTVLINPDLKGNFEPNWYNLFYNIETWYVVKSKFE